MSVRLPAPDGTNEYAIDFEERTRRSGSRNLEASDLSALVVNVTLKCNQSCLHCHVSSDPQRGETMGPEVMSRVLEIAASVRPSVVDVTGGAPELHPGLPDLLLALHRDGRRVQVRTNLTVLERDEYRDLAGVYAEAGVELLASMPCYTRRNIELVRGGGVHATSVRALRRLNDLGFGVEGGLRLDLIYNPVGTTLPEPQASLEELFREELAQRFGIAFTHLLTMTNMPAGRFREHLLAVGGYHRYLVALRAAFNPEVVPHLQCRHQVEIGWDGRLYDCDFNLGEGLTVASSAPGTVWDFDAEALSRRRVVHGAHCFGCTAGAGSS